MAAPRRRHLAPIAVCVVVAVGILGGWALSPRRTDSAVRSDLVGATIPPTMIIRSNGASATLSDLLAGRSAAIVVASGADCLTCARYALELRIIRDRYPGVLTLFVGSGPDHVFFSEFLRTNRMESFGYLDPGRSLIKALGLDREPAVLLVNSAGRIVYADLRRPSTFARFPLSRILDEMSTFLQVSDSSAPDSGR